jgi:hypothetical protein
MKNFFGRIILRVGGWLWQNGGYTDADHTYDDLNMWGKLGYNMVCTGARMTGVVEFTENEIIFRNGTRINIE